MRLKIEVKSDIKPLKVPFNYNHIITAIIYKKINDIELARKLHNSNGFKFFTFSELKIPKREIFKNFILSKDGKFYFYISSPNMDLIKNLIDGFIEHPKLNFLGKDVYVEHVKLLKPPIIKKRMVFKTLSPIIVRTMRENKGTLKQWDLNPNDLKFYENMQNNLLKKYKNFYGDYRGDEYLKIIPYLNSIKRKRIMIPSRNSKTYHRAYHMKFSIEGDIRLIKFGYDCGFGEKNSMGFGMVRKA